MLFKEEINANTSIKLDLTWNCAVPLIAYHALYTNTFGTKPKAEFRQEVVDVALTSGLCRKQVASDFVIGFSTLSRWITEERSQIKPSEPQIDLIQENTRLCKEVRMFRDGTMILQS